MVYSPVACMRVSSACWRGCEFGLLAFELAFGAGDGHAFAGAEPEQVDFEFGEGGQDVEEHLAEGVGGVVDGAADATRAPRNQESGYSFAAGDSFLTDTPTPEVIAVARDPACPLVAGIRVRGPGSQRPAHSSCRAARHPARGGIL